MKRIVGGLLFWGIITSIFAEAIVVDYSSSAEPNSESKALPISSPGSTRVVTPMPSNLSVEQRVNKLEQQVNNINEQNLPNRLEELQQNLQKINGMIEAQAHQVEQLNKQLKDFYQDLNQRLGTVKQAPSVSKDATLTNTTAAVDSSVVPATTSNIAGAFDNLQQAPKINNDSVFLKEQQMYQTAIDLLPDKKHESENRLRDYLKQYPKGAYVANAHYWLGEINFLQKNFDAAEEEFKVVVDKYPKSKRVADSAFKLALVHQNQGREVEAKQELQRIIKRYPGTSAAQLAKQRLGMN